MKKQAIVLGSGPAGDTAALYLRRAGIDALRITGYDIGGQLTQTSSIENWPGAFSNPSGFDLMDSLDKQLKKIGAESATDQIVSAEFGKDVILLKGDSDTYECCALIVATGAKAKYLGLDSEKKFIGNGISACATCDGFFYKKKIVTVIGGGSTALTDALYLSELASKVHLVHRRSEFRAESVLIERIMNLAEQGKIELHLDCVPESFNGSDFLSSVTLRNKITGETCEFATDGAFVAIGHEPNTAFLNGALELCEGHIKTGFGAFKTQTSIKGVFAAGDVVFGSRKQAIVAAGMGCEAALDAADYLRNL